LQAKYVLVTAAYNEEKNITRTIKSVLNQTLRPEKWVIVSDGSTDGTDAIVKKFSALHDFIKYAQQEKRASDERRLEQVTIAQARAMALGISLMASVPYEFLGNLDADIRLVPDFYEHIIRQMVVDETLGIAGGGVYSIDHTGKTLLGGFIQPNFVGGPTQVFRRACLEALGGYLEAGHADCVAVSRAKMKGWKVKTFPDVRAFQYEMPKNTIREKVPTCFRMGHMDYLMGGLFTFQLIRCINRMIHPPFFFAGAAMLMGYFKPRYCKEKIRVPQTVVEYMQLEQVDKLIKRLPFGHFIGFLGELEARYIWKNKLSQFDSAGSEHN
jgi:glycosyltransferase involved in cell wall biosynthesis